MADIPATLAAPSPNPVAMMLGGNSPLQTDPNLGPTATPPPPPAAAPTQPAQPTAAATDQPTQPQSPNVASDPEMHAAGVHHGRIGRAIDAVSKALGGSRAMHVVENPDGSFTAKEVDSTPGERWSRIAAAALKGAAAGFAGGQGYGGGAGAFSSGVQTGFALPQQEQDKTMKKADDLEKQREQKLTFDKNQAMLDLNIGMNKLRLQQMPVEFAAEMADHAAKQIDFVQQYGGSHLATYTNSKDLNDHLQANQELADKLVGKGGMLYQIPRIQDGKLVGVDVYGIPQNKMNVPIDKPVQIPRVVLNADLSGTHLEYTTLPAGTPLKEVVTAQKQQDIENDKVGAKLAELKTQRQTADAATKRAETDAAELNSRIAKNYAQAEKDKDNVKTPKLTGYVDPSTGIPFVFNNKGKAVPMELPEGMSAIKQTDLATFQQKQQTPAIKADQAYNMVKTFATNMKNGIANPIEQRVALQMALQAPGVMSPTGISGGTTGRSNAALTAAMKDRGLADDKINLINRLINGQPITQTQMDNALRTINAYRRGLWRTAAEQGTVNHMKPEEVIPADTPGREGLLNEIYAGRGQQPPTPGANNAGQGQNKTLPKPLADTTKYPIKDGKQWNGEGWYPVQVQ